MTVTHAPGMLRMTPARWVALLIGAPLALAIIAWTSFSLVTQIGQASFPVVKSIPLQNGRLSVDVGSGNLTVRPGLGGAAHLAGTVRYSLVRPDISTGTLPDGTTDMNLRCRLSLGNCELNATLSVPPRTGVTLSSGGGDMTVSGVEDGVNLSSDGGNVAVSGVGGRVSVSTGGGDLTAGDLAGTLRFTTDGGNIDGRALASSDLKARSFGGDATLTFTKPPRSLDIGSDGGNITVLLPHTSSGYAISTTSDGGPAGEPQDMINASSVYKIVLNSGGGNITVAWAN